MMQREKLAGVALALLVLASAWSAAAVSGRLRAAHWPGMHAPQLRGEPFGDPFDELDALSFEYGDETMPRALPRGAAAKSF